ncbi:hypothetical protein HK098_007648 [Nowakowskiella sp. JEL0407]|nr:hypothetical protein HK098_007648 [Nowakowskiella sp. JEL0407]
MSPRNDAPVYNAEYDNNEYIELDEANLAIVERRYTGTFYPLRDNPHSTSSVINSDRNTQNIPQISVIRSSYSQSEVSRTDLNSRDGYSSGSTYLRPTEIRNNTPSINSARNSTQQDNYRASDYSGSSATLAKTYTSELESNYKESKYRVSESELQVPLLPTDEPIRRDVTAYTYKTIGPKQNQAYFLIIVTVIQVGLMIYSLVLNWQITGSVIQTNPFNFLIGPSPQTLIFMGARFVPCMQQNVTLGGQKIPTGNTSLTCPPFVKGENSTCTLNDICGFGGFRDRAVPDQWYRIFFPMFLHGGVVHLVFNLLFQIKSGFPMEKEIGWWRIAIIYLVSGSAGFLFGIKYSAGVSAVGASGSLFGLIGALLLDLIFNWSLIARPLWEFFKLILMILIVFFVGTLPSIDNFAHVGGFVVGICLSLVFLPKRHMRTFRWGKIVDFSDQ